MSLRSTRPHLCAVLARFLTCSRHDARVPAAHRALDVVRIAHDPDLIADGSAGHDGVVDQVREMEDGTYRYVVASIHDADVDTGPGIYRQDQLVATGRSLSLRDVDYLAAVEGPLGRRGSSWLVDADGRVVGEVGYTVVDEAAHHV